MVAFVKTFTDNGPYYRADRDVTVVGGLGPLLSAVRTAFEEGVDSVGIFDGAGNPKGIWAKDIDGYVDSAGDSVIEGEAYELLRPDTTEQWWWGRLQAELAGTSR